ncbi:MAG: hypothetical protein K0S48_31 [Ramlibacter sp.]|nr:hypothetical protein [Ramlibacter sp.]
MTRALFPVIDLWAAVRRRCQIAYYRWALAEISPLHEDVPMIVHRLRTLQERV